MKSIFEVLPIVAFGLLACGESPGPSGATGRLEVALKPLSLSEVVDACYRLTVYNEAGRGSGSVVWTQPSICASRYGDGVGAVSFVGTCDADAETNWVELVLLDLYEDVGGSATPIAIADYENPCPIGDPCVLPSPCTENADERVTFDLTILRRAKQGFFDIAVNFDDLFCSAKFDCEDEEQENLPLLFDASGKRAAATVLGFACTGGPKADTHLYMSSVVLSCTGLGAPIVLNPAIGTGGNAWTPPRPAGSSVVYQYSVFEGREELGDLNKAYWNIAIGVDPVALAGAGVCTLTVTATASDGPFANESPERDTVYPLLTWNIILNPGGGGDIACGRSGLGEGGVVTVYTKPGESFCFEHSLTTDWSIDEDVDTSTTCVCVWRNPPRAIARNGVIVPIVRTASGNRAVVPVGLVDGGSYDLQSLTEDLTLKLRTNYTAFAGTDEAVFTCDHLGQEYVELLVSDPHGFKSTAGTFVIIQDNDGVCGPEAPPESDLNAICHSGLVVNMMPTLDGPPMARVNATAFDAGSYDSDTPSGLTIGIADAGGPYTPSPTLTFGCDQVSNHRGIWVTITDGQGHSSTCQSSLQVTDELNLCGDAGGGGSPTAPQVVALQHIAVELVAVGNATCPRNCYRGAGRVDVPASAFNQGSFDDETSAGGLRFGARIYSGTPPTDSLSYDCWDLGAQSLFFVVTDRDGESSFVPTQVIVQDNHGICDCE